MKSIIADKTWLVFDFIALDTNVSRICSSSRKVTDIPRNTTQDIQTTVASYCQAMGELKIHRLTTETPIKTVINIMMETVMADAILSIILQNLSKAFKTSTSFYRGIQGRFAPVYPQTIYYNVSLFLLRGAAVQPAFAMISCIRDTRSFAQVFCA